MNPSPSPEMLSAWLQTAAQAPSAHNTQPWLVRQVGSNEGGELEIGFDPAHTLQAGDPTLRESYIGIGTFLENLLLAAAQDSYRPEVTYTAFAADPQGPAVRLRFLPGESANPTEQTLYAAISQRHTNRGLYKPEPLSQEQYSALESTQLEPGVNANWVTENEAKQRVGDLVGRGIVIGLSLPPLKEELATLVSFQREGRDSGMQVEAMTQAQEQQSQSGSDWLLHELDVQAQSRFDTEKFATAPLLLILTTATDGPAAWLAAGRSLERLLLTAANQGLNHCISAAPVEIPTLAPLLRQETTSKERPQVLVRFGIPQDPSFTTPSPRRRVDVVNTPS